MPAPAQGCRGAAQAPPPVEVWGRELEVARGQALDEDARARAFDLLPPDEFRRALDDQLELQRHAERLQFVKRKLGLEKHCALAQEAAVGAPVGMEVGARAFDYSGGEETPDFEKLEA
eukprot:9202085-Alexandrium_andersonii.AAC.1